LNAKITNLTAQQVAIDLAISADPLDRMALKERMEVEDDLSKSNFDLMEDIEVVLTMDKKAERSNVYRTHCKDKQRLITNRGKVYMLTIGQCTQALKDKLKEDATWDTISDSYDAIGLLALIEKYVLKQTKSHYPYLAVQEESRSMLKFSQGEDMTLVMYYEKFTTRVAIAERAGCSFVTQSLLDLETETQFPSQVYSVLGDPDRLKVEKNAKDKYLAVLFLMRSGKRHLQLQNDIKNDHAKGVEKAFPSTIASAMQILNDYKPVVTESPKQAALGTAFAQDGTKKKTKGQLTDKQWNALSLEAKSALIKNRKDEKAAKPAAASGDAKKSSSKKDDDDSSVTSTKSMSDLQKENARLKRSNKKVKAALITTINEGNEDSSLSEEGSQCFNAAMAVVLGNYAELRNGIALAHRTPDLNLRNEILIDSQTMHNVFCNTKYVNNVRKAKKNLHLSTNGGGMVISREADVSGLYPDGYDDTVYYGVRAITNILSFKNMAKVYRINYDSDVAKTFTVHRESHGLVDLHFTMHPCGLHLLEQPKKGSVFILTVDENKKLFSN
jgi:hypothetical protein